MGQEPPASPSPASATPAPAYTTEKPGQVHYNSHHTNVPSMPNTQAYYPQQYQNEYRPPQGSYQQSQPQAHAQPQVVVVQQQSKSDNSALCCIPCACCAGCLAGAFCCPCCCCC